MYLTIDDIDKSKLDELSKYLQNGDQELWNAKLYELIIDSINDKTILATLSKISKLSSDNKFRNYKRLTFDLLKTAVQHYYSQFMFHMNADGQVEYSGDYDINAGDLIERVDEILDIWFGEPNIKHKYKPSKYEPKVLPVK